MYNKFMTKEQLAVKVGDHVVVQGNKGIVTEVHRGCEQAYDMFKGEYVNVDGKDFTNIRVNFTGELANWGQYQNGTYSNWQIVNDLEKWEKYL